MYQKSPPQFPPPFPPILVRNEKASTTKLYLQQTLTAETTRTSEVDKV